MWAIWTFVAPFACALFAFLFPRGAVHAAMAAAVGILASSTLTVWGVARDGSRRLAVGGWPAPLGIELHVDGLSALMLAATAVVGTVSTFYARGYMARHSALERTEEPGGGEDRHEHALFWPLWLSLWGSLNALFLSGDLFNLYVTLELIGLSSTALISLAGNAPALIAATRYLLVSLVGSFCYLAGVGLIYAACGTLDLALLADLIHGGTLPAVALALMTAGLLLKTALFPLHFWLPPAHGNAPAPVSALLSALVVKAPYYLMLRLWIEVFAPVVTPGAAHFLGILGTGAILWGSAQALLTDRVKPLVAYSTVSQLGYLFLVFPLAREAGAGLFAWNGAAYFILSHAAAKASMFLAAGTLLSATESDRLDHLDGISQCIPLPMFAFSIAGASLIGLPPSGGFMAKWLLLKSALTGGQWGYLIVILLGGLLTVTYVFRVFSRAFMYKPMVTACHLLPRGMHWSPLVLSLISLCLGLFASQVLSLLEAGSPWTQPGLGNGEP
jgi:formate hydrogenlyase subunit 3/multisubunit Na+/H+ antiporter MnhD subunit